MVHPAVPPSTPGEGSSGLSGSLETEEARGGWGKSWRRFVILLAISSVMMALAACGGGANAVTVQLLAQEGSSQAGNATLRADGDVTEVQLTVNPGPAANDPQPVHIHFGSCGPGLGTVDQALTDVVGGESNTPEVPMSLDSLTDGNHAINVHKSYPEISVYTACGNIPAR